VQALPVLAVAVASRILLLHTQTGTAEQVSLAWPDSNPDHHHNTIFAVIIIIVIGFVVVVIITNM
jgi:uncharacterized Rmd1/YagE family protein